MILTDLTVKIVKETVTVMVIMAAMVIMATMVMETVVVMAPLHHHQIDVAVESSSPPQYQALLQNQTHHKSFQEPPRLCT